MDFRFIRVGVNIFKKDVALVERFVNQDNVDFLMGPTSGGIAMGLSEFARENKKILVLTQAAADALTGAKFHPYVFSTLCNAMTHSRSGTTEADKIIEAIEKVPLVWETPEGWKTMRSEGHSAVEDCLWGQTSPNVKYGFAIPKSFESIQGEEICRTDEKLKAAHEEYMNKSI